VYDSRSRAFLELVARALGFEWVDVVRFENRVTDALEIQEADMLTWVSLLLVRTLSHEGEKLIFRRRSCHWVVCRPTSARHWGWPRSCFRNGWYLWYDWFLGWSRWCGHDYDYGGFDGCKYRWEGYGETYERSPDVRIQAYS
jgi:hypothetical protein